MERKYYAWLKVKSFYVDDYLGRGPTCFKDVTVPLYRRLEIEDYEKEKQQYNFHILIKNYLGNDRSEDCILELFTKEEIDAMKYIESALFSDSEFFYAEKNFPIESNQIPLEEWSSIRDALRYAFVGDDNHPLPFKVHGYFNPEAYHYMNADLGRLLDRFHTIITNCSNLTGSELCTLCRRNKNLACICDSFSS